jgi:glycosyltransferase involved in cell wall biosynthesis
MSAKLAESHSGSQMSQLVTVYIPTYNRLHLLQRAVDSVLKQTHRNVELIIVDDNSNDGTKEYLKALSEKDHRVIFRINSLNLGAGASRNIAISAARGEFITGLDDDDYFSEQRIQDFVQFWHRKKPEAVALFSSVIIRSNETEYTVDKKIPIVCQSDLAYCNYVGNQIFSPTQSLRQIHGFDAGLPAWQDLDCWYRVLEKGSAERVDNESYVVDVSHQYERISQGGLKKVKYAASAMRNKYNLQFKDTVRLMCQKTDYSPSLMGYLANLVSSILIWDRHLWRISLVRMKKYIRGRIYT